MAIGTAIGIPFKMAGQSWSSYWTSLYYTLKSGDTWYRRETNTAGGYFILWFSPDAGVTWEELLNLDITESDPVIDLIHQYTHQIVGTAYQVVYNGEILYTT